LAQLQERTFSDPGMNVATKYPKYAFTYLTELLGVQVDSDIVRAYQIRFPYVVPTIMSISFWLLSRIYHFWLCLCLPPGDSLRECWSRD
jgi:hypothetical protein